MITAADILAAARRHRLDVPTDLADIATSMFSGDIETRAHEHVASAAASASLAADIAAEIEREPFGSGPLAGVTLAIKDNIAVANTPTRLGSGLAGWIPRRDATIVSRLYDAGASLVAKAQCEAFLLGANSFTSRPAPVPNPRDPRRSAGGSSSGSASLVARGACRASIGTDSGGSIRIPAAFCGVVGFKPSRGVVPYTGIAPLEPFLESVGPLARSVADVATLFSVIAGPDGLDCRAGWRAPMIVGERLSTSPVRLAMLSPAFEMLAPGARKVFDEAVSRIRAAGVAIEAVETDFLERANNAHIVVYAIGQATTLLRDQSVGPLAASLPDGWSHWWADLDRAALPKELALSLALGAAWAEKAPSAYARALVDAEKLANELDGLLSGFDALILPTAADIAPFLPDGPPSLDAVFGDTRLTAPFNLTGHPAMSIPAGSAYEMPLGLQVIAARGADQSLLRIAAIIERALASPVEKTATQLMHGGQRLA